MRMSLVIPVWNDPEGLVRLLSQVCDMTCFTEIIVYDDASQRPCGPDMPGLLPAVAIDPRLVWLRGTTQMGAGHARNRALDKVTGSHVLFFDSDDLFLPPFGDLVSQMEPEETPFDFCLFCHVDSRTRAHGGLGPLPADDRIWTAAQIGTAPRPLEREDMIRFSRIDAYPWNKIYRTAFLRENAIRCTEIPVHNDIELHWMSFLRARRILASSLLCCEHFVIESGTRLTNRNDKDRFEVFQALDHIQAELLRNPRLTDYAEPFNEFCARLFAWISTGLEPGLQAEFAGLARDFVRDRVPEPLFALLALQNPALADRFLRLMKGTGR